MIVNMLLQDFLKKSDNFFKLSYDWIKRRQKSARKKPGARFAPLCKIKKRRRAAPSLIRILKGRITDVTDLFYGSEEVINDGSPSDEYNAPENVPSEFTESSTICFDVSKIAVSVPQEEKTFPASS